MNRDTPIPESMTDLPIRAGYPVPYVADWTGEEGETFVFDPELGFHVVKTGGRPGVGEPRFGRQNPMRQRECMMRKLCQVCHTTLGEAPWWFIAEWLPQDGVTVDVDNPIEPYIEEPPLCTSCLRYAISVCPGLNREHAVSSGMIVYRTYEYEWALRGNNIPGVSYPVVDFVLARLTAYTKCTREQFV